MSTIPTLRTGRLILRPFSKGDRDAMVAALMSDADAMAQLPGKEDCSDLEGQRRVADEYIDELNRPWSEGAPGSWAVCAGVEQLGPVGELIGFCGFLPEKVEGAGPELGYGLAKAYWEKGLATEAALASMDWVFSQDGISCVYAVFGREHTATRRVLEKLGMAQRGEVDLYDSVAQGLGLLPLYTVSRAMYLQRRRERDRS